MKCSSFRTEYFPCLDQFLVMNYFPNSPLVTTDFIFDGGILFSLGLYLCTETHYIGISPLKYILIDGQLSHL